MGPAQQIVGIYLQVVVQDSSGNLVSYLETSRVEITDPAKLNQLIDQNMNQLKSNIINVGGQNLEIIKLNNTIVAHYPNVIPQDQISVSTRHVTEVLAVASHDGYPVVLGDKVTKYWTIIRTAAS